MNDLYRSVLGTLSKIYDVVFLRKQSTASRCELFAKKIHHGDTLQGLKYFPDESIGVILCVYACAFVLRLLFSLRGGRTQASNSECKLTEPFLQAGFNLKEEISPNPREPWVQIPTALNWEGKNQYIWQTFCSFTSWFIQLLWKIINILIIHVWLC